MLARPQYHSTGTGMATQSSWPLTPWYLLGAGSLGCLYAAYLRHAGCDVRLLLRDASSLDQLHRSGGICLQRGNDKQLTAIAADTPPEIQEPIQHLLICTKAQQTLDAVRAIKPHLASRAVIVLLQNGMGVRELLQHEIPGAIFLHAISTEGAYQTQRFQVIHAGHGSTVIGAIDSSQNPIAQRVAESLRCELAIDVIDDIEQRLWLKLAVNSIINPLTALHACRNGELLQLPNIDLTITNLCIEFVEVASADGKNLTLEQCRAAVYDVIHATAQNRSSMLQDRLAKRPTEIDFINGFIVQRAQQYGIAFPYHAALVVAMKAPSP
jgi:2-dehydropantoate 2-reductase